MFDEFNISVTTFKTKYLEARDICLVADFKIRASV
jgi:hypothetical protein